MVAGRCFAGNAALVGCCDVIIVTRDSNLGMGGPAMIEGGGLGVFRPEEIGPSDVQSANGVVDIVVEDEAEAVMAAKEYLSYFQGNLPRLEPAPISANCVGPFPRTGGESMTFASSSRCSPMKTPCWNWAVTLRRAW